MASEIKKDYEELRKKYSLPDYKSMDDDFEISCIDDGDSLLRDIDRKIAEKIEFFADIINSVLQPDTSSLTDMHECRFFNDAEKKVLFDLYKVLMGMHRASIELLIHNNEKETAEFIKDTCSKWGNVKKSIAATVRKMKETWQKEISYKEELGYLG